MEADHERHLRADGLVEERDVLHRLQVGAALGVDACHVFTGVALERAGRAAAIDHSPDMVDATGKYNARAVAEGRLEAVLGDAAKLPGRMDPSRSRS